MIPRISPGKTWEGFAGAIVAAIARQPDLRPFPREHMAGMNTIHAVVLGVILGLAAVLGDLIESLFKREAGVKDSGRVLPRHRRHTRLVRQFVV